MTTHIVKQGECLASIAKKYGFVDWRTIYNHPDNAGFRDARPNPNVIYPNDRIVIPDREQKEQDSNTEQVHSFRCRRPKVLLRLKLLDENRDSWAGRSYKLVVGDSEFDGTTDDEGLIEQEIPVDAESGQLTVMLPPRKDVSDKELQRVDYVDQDDSENTSSASSSQESAAQLPNESADEEEEPFVWELTIGHLDPIDEVSGVQARLYNLGFDPGPIDGVTGPLTRSAIKRFQQAFDLQVDGIAGPNTKTKLLEQHCS